MAGAISMTAIYGIAALLSLIIAIGYCSLVRKKEFTLILIHFSIFIVNTGYFLLAISKSLEEALLANRIAYLGSAFLPLFMFLTIMNVCEMKAGKLLRTVLLLVSTAMFLLAASGGYLNVYYKEVTLKYVNGAAKLVKVYGPLHGLYMIYLFVYLGLMVGIILYAMIKKKSNAYKLAIFLATIVLGNVGIWLVEQLIQVDFEFLSVSYIVMELMLTLVYSMFQDKDCCGIRIEKKQLEMVPEVTADAENETENQVQKKKEAVDEGVQLAAVVEEMECEPDPQKEKWVYACPEVNTLTGREIEVLALIMENKKRKDIASELNVSENTVKKHTSHIFSKIGVANRTELFEKLK